MALALLHRSSRHGDILFAYRGAVLRLQSVNPADGEQEQAMHVAELLDHPHVLYGSTTSFSYWSRFRLCVFVFALAAWAVEGTGPGHIIMPRSAHTLRVPTSNLHDFNLQLPTSTPLPLLLAAPAILPPLPPHLAPTATLRRPSCRRSLAASPPTWCLERRGASAATRSRSTCGVWTR